MNDLILMAGDEPGQGDGLDEIETGVVTRTRPKTKKPSNYKVLMLNDDYTPMEFVVLDPAALFLDGPRRRDPRDAPGPPAGCRRLRRVHL